MLPIWGVQRERELDEFISYIEHPPVMTEEITAVIEHDRKRTLGRILPWLRLLHAMSCRIEINNCARMSLDLCAAPSEAQLTPEMQAKMKKIEGACTVTNARANVRTDWTHPALLAKNYEDYKRVLAGEVSVK